MVDIAVVVVVAEKVDDNIPLEQEMLLALLDHDNGRDEDEVDVVDADAVVKHTQHC